MEMKQSKKTLLNILFSFLFFTCTEIHAKQIDVGDRLNQIANDQGYGFKTANLNLLSELSGTLKSSDYPFAIPKSFGISSNQTQQFIEKNLHINLASEWEELISKTKLNDKQILVEVIETKNLPDNFLEEAKKVEAKINRVFEEFINNLKAEQNLSDLFRDIDQKELNKLIASIKSNNEKCRVSHGTEDTDELASTGNQSVADVSPNTKELLEAIKIIVASYFSEKSLVQRLSAGNISLFETPILIQCMIIEPDYTFAVPEFFGISSNQTQQFMEKNLHIDLVNEWAKIISETKLNDDQILAEMIETKNFPDSFLEKTKIIEASINKEFDRFIQDINAEQNLKTEQNLSDLFPDIDQNELKRLIASIESNNEKLMVRSTGKEDTDELANAGGNESVANVSPNTKQLLRAIKIVVASYFSEKSLVQRLASGDRSLRKTPVTPILIQRMIGEKSGEPLPLCGVMFTEETEGALSKAKFRDSGGQIETSGITIIQAAYGHNEGVVNSIVAVDTHLVSNDGDVYSVIRPKRFRIAPTEALTLGRRDNEDDLTQRQALSEEAILALKYLAVQLETFYKKPMDVEYVIDRKTRTIYIVQARPIIHNPEQPAPSYLDFGNPIVAKMSSVQGQAIGVGGGALQLIGNPNEVIATKTIGDALTAYLDRKDKKVIKVILVGQMAPATSHEATTFRSELKPVICIPNNFSEVEQWLSDEQIGRASCRERV